MRKEGPSATAGNDNERVNSRRLGEEIVGWIERLAVETDEPGKLTRLYLGAAHKRASDHVSAWMRGAGMSVRVDAATTVVGRYDGATAGAPTLILGSHIDTVRNAGRFDGTLGVLTAIAVVGRLAAAGRRLPFAIEVVAFGDEEGVRYPSTLTGSRALAGRFDPRTLDEVDRDGIVRRDALSAFGCNGAEIASAARDPRTTLGYVEIHIEQGPVLEAEHQPVGVVTAIVGASRGRISFTGVAGHAGTVPMAVRRDALAAAAEAILFVERYAGGVPGLVATVGVVDVADAAVNAIPGHVALSYDVRCTSDATRAEAVADLAREVAAIAARRRLSGDLTPAYDAPSATCDAHLADALATAIARNGLTPRRLPSGAGHDAMSFKDRLPFAMLFVRCKGGLSHQPDEFASLDDIDVAAAVLLDFLTSYSPPHA